MNDQLSLPLDERPATEQPADQKPAAPTGPQKYGDRLYTSLGELRVDMYFPRQPKPSYRLTLPEGTELEVQIDLDLRLFARGQRVLDPEGYVAIVNRSNRDWKCDACRATLHIWSLKAYTTARQRVYCLNHLTPLETLRELATRLALNPSRLPKHW